MSGTLVELDNLHTLSHRYQPSPPYPVVDHQVAQTTGTYPVIFLDYLIIYLQINHLYLLRWLSSLLKFQLVRRPNFNDIDNKLYAHLVNKKW